jgi:hypothetical protein
MRFVVNHDRVTVADYVVEFARKLPEGESFDERTLYDEEVGPDDTTIEQYRDAIDELLRERKIMRTR